MVLETLVCSPLDHLTRLIAPQSFTENSSYVKKHKQSVSKHFSVYLTNTELLCGTVD